MGFKKLYVGFVIIVLLSLLNLVFNYLSAKKNISSMTEMNQKIAPYVQKLNDLKDIVTVSKLYTTSWVFLPKNKEDKKQLRQFQKIGYPTISTDILVFIETYPQFEEQDSIREILKSFDEVILYESEIMSLLNTFSSYEEGSIAPAMAQDILAFQVLPQSKALLKRLNEIVYRREILATSLSHDIDLSLNKMLKVVPVLSFIIFLIIIFSIFYIHKYITKPVVSVQRVLHKMAKGMFLPIKEVSGDGIIKDMIYALQTLNKSFENTSSFAVNIGKGKFDTKYQPLSNEDELGKALIEMRDSLLEYSTEMEIKVEKRTEELQQALTDLKSTQSQLIQAEKMASLGQLIAGVAHEVNTPIGAISASVGAIKDAINNSRKLIPQVHVLLSESQLSLFNQLIETGFSNSDTVFSSREERKHKKELKQYFEEAGFDHSKKLASQFADIGIYKGLSDYNELLKLESVDLIMKTAYFLVLQKKSCKNIELAVKKATKVVFALKTYSRKEENGEKSQSNITENIETVLTLYKNTFRQGVEIKRDYEAVPDINCYIDELGQVWTNLITNAVYAMDSKGDLSIGIKNLEDTIEVSFGDNGSGIPEERLKEIFTPFYTTKKKGEGTGLGLDIVKKIVDKHQGTIAVTSEVGKGTKFIIFWT